MFYSNTIRREITQSLPLTFNKIVLALSPLAVTFFRPSSTIHSLSSPNFLRNSSIFLREAPRFVQKQPTSLLARQPLLLGALILSGALLIHQVLKLNNLHPNQNCERLGQVCPIEPLPLLAP